VYLKAPSFESRLSLPHGVINPFHGLLTRQRVIRKYQIKVHRQARHVLEKIRRGQQVISADLFAPLKGLFRGLCYDGTAKCRQIIRLSCGYLIPVYDNVLIYLRKPRVKS